MEYVGTDNNGEPLFDTFELYISKAFRDKYVQGRQRQAAAGSGRQ